MVVTQEILTLGFKIFSETIKLTSLSDTDVLCRGECGEGSVRATAVPDIP